LRAEACYIGKVEKARVPMHDIVSITAEHHTFEVIVEQPPGNTSQVGKRVQVTPNEPGRIRRDGKAQVGGSRPAQRHDEGVEPTGASVVCDEAEVAPVHLPLLSRSRFKAN
jgi:hypothetical protein